MDTQLTADELPKKEIAKKVVTPKHRYFFPDHGFSVEASSYTDALSEADKKLKAIKDSDEH
jgi:hypothetical protein